MVSTDSPSSYVGRDTIISIGTVDSESRVSNVIIEISNTSNSCSLNQNFDVYSLNVNSTFGAIIQQANCALDIYSNQIITVSITSINEVNRNRVYTLNLTYVGTLSNVGYSGINSSVSQEYFSAISASIFSCFTKKESGIFAPVRPLG